MQVRVDQAKCQSHNRCIVVAPALFDLDDELKSFAIAATVVEGQEEAARTAVRNCPERAITVIE